MVGNLDVLEVLGCLHYLILCERVLRLVWDHRIVIADCKLELAGWDTSVIHICPIYKTLLWLSRCLLLMWQHMIHFMQVVQTRLLRTDTDLFLLNHGCIFFLSHRTTRLAPVLRLAILASWVPLVVTLWFLQIRAPSSCATTFLLVLFKVDILGVMFRCRWCRRELLMDNGISLLHPKDSTEQGLLDSLSDSLCPLFFYSLLNLGPFLQLLTEEFIYFRANLLCQFFIFKRANDVRDYPDGFSTVCWSVDLLRHLASFQHVFVHTLTYIRF